MTSLACVLRNQSSPSSCETPSGYLNSMNLNFSNYDKPYPRVIKCSSHEKKEEKRQPIFENEYKDDYLYIE